ncbi:MAG TPA: bifunctional riboflavin kinase/FAD synthetase [Arenimonas sp.]|uniref:bifunctional riboflavin kinase/FAD synthetase n=1 Tax=Arenimonas sp. TaxID=1872635 RepID=UPI002BE5B701|nr:bifunctional riboflavin kinase/FAD synthetase [Arenimonas sp.]HMB55967.1 bifunctional riboflavin kinase/FAD synthetase [Arenimonas sp.]
MSQLFRDIQGSALCPQGSVVCIGAFDGLHRGHQALIGRALARARELGVPLVALSFEPLPREFFAPTLPPPRLLLPRGKFEGLRDLGVDVVGLLRFDRALASMPAADFIESVLLRRLSAKEIWVGPDFRFGKGREGDVAMLRKIGNERGFSVCEIAPVLSDGERLSSSQLRLQLAAGDLDGAARILGHRYAIAGKVVRGKQLGRTLGYPTANIRLAGKRPALMGIYATWVHGVGAEPIASVSSLGTRPTVSGLEPLLEAHLFDFDGDLYGKRIRVEFVAKLRDEEKFDGLPALVAQMNRDAEQARKLLQHDHEDMGVSA